MTGKKAFVFLFVIAFFSLFPNINLYEFRGEESLRVIVAYEMVDSGDYMQPTFLGDLYFNKPPLFNWLIVLSSHIIPWSELTARIISIISVFLTAFIIYILSFKLFKNKILSLLSGILYVVSIDILFWYGYLAEIDATLSFFISLMFYFQLFGYLENRKDYILISGIIAGISFLLKGFPAYVFFGLTYISLIFYKKRFRDIFNPYLWLSGIFAILIPAIWIINTANPDKYIKKLFLESIVRTKGGSDFLKLLYHFISYPVLNFKQLIPGSLIALFVLLKMGKSRKIPNFSPDIKLLVFVFLVNYLPYFVSVHSRGRYVIPLFPIIVIVLSYLIVNLGKDRWVRIAVYTAGFLIVIRFLVGVVGFPILMEKKASRKRAAYDIAQKIDLSKKIACDCKREKTVCVYLDFMKGKALKTSRYIPDWDYLIDCSDKKRGRLISAYDLRGRVLKLYERER